MDRSPSTRASILVPAALLVASGLVAFHASRGGFLSMMLFPHVFAVLVVGGAISTLRSNRGFAMPLRIGLVAAVAVVAVAAPVAHTLHARNLLRANERAGMAAVGGAPAPAILYLHAFGLPGERAENGIEFGGRVTLVNFWATWCGPCVSEIPLLEDFWLEQREAGIDVVGVTRLYGDPASSESEIEEIGEFLQGLEVSYPVVVETPGASAFRRYRVASLPSSVLIDRDGEVIAYGAGVSGTKRLLRQARALVAGSRAGS